MGTYDGPTATALSLISRKGGKVTITRAGADVKDPVTQAVTPGAKTIFVLPCLGLPPGRSWVQRGATLVGQNSEELSLAPKGYRPVKTDVVAWKGQQWSITDWVEYDPDGSGPIYTRLLVER